MKKEYDFSKAEQGKFYRAGQALEMPIYLDREVEKFYLKKISTKNGLNRVVNTILRKEMEMLKEIGA